jgi:hypothetical protein
MKRALSLLFVSCCLVPLVLTSACEGDSSDCCPVSETFTCSNFSFGGARSLQPSGECRTGYSDNLPTVTGKKVDAKGCTYWEPDPSGARTCGVARPVDGGADAGHDASMEDAHHDDGGGDGGDDAADASDGAIDH